MAELPAAETLAEMLEDTKRFPFSLHLAPAEMRMVTELVEDTFRITGVRLSKRDLIVRGIHMQWQMLTEDRSGPLSGRPTKLTPQVEQTILHALGQGANRREVAAMVGVSRDTLWRWMDSNTPFSDECQKMEIALMVRRVKRQARQRQAKQRQPVAGDKA